MAEKLDTMPKRRGRATVHPWAEWTDGSVWKAKRGEDFAAEVESFRTQLYGKAARMGKKLAIDVDKDAETVTFQFTDAG